MTTTRCRAWALVSLEESGIFLKLGRSNTFRLIAMRYIMRDLSVDTERRTVCRDGVALKLPELSFDALVELIEAAPRPVNATQFASAVWRTQHVSDDTIAQRITLLRKSLADDPKQPVYIRTVRGAGYALLCPVVRDESKPPRRVGELLHPRALAAAASLAAIAGVLILFITGLPGTNAEAPRQTVAQQPQTDIDALVQNARANLNLHQSRETDRAIDMLHTALEIDPQHFDARLTLSFALTTRGTKFGGNEAEEQHSEAIARSLIAERPNSSNAWSALGYALDAQGRANEALPAYQTAYRLDPGNAPALSSAAYTLMLQGKLYQALDLEVRARQSGSNSRYSEIQIASLMELIGHPAAKTWREKALSLNPGQVVVLSELAKSNLRRGELQAALDVLNQAEGDDQLAPSILQLRGRIAVSLGQVTEARDYFQKAGEKGELELAALNAMLGEVGDAENLLRYKMSQLEDSTWPGFRVYLAEVLASLGKEEEALALVKRAINLGWRDVDWLKQSPFLGPAMLSSEGRQIEARIKRELAAQRRLILDAAELAIVFDS
ncbi:MAG: tetratricopeptide repeat protein [Pseudomonadota bacterium]